MELLQLKYFHIVAQTEHLSNAAKELMIAQPALSQTIHRLENELGYELFDRQGRGLKLNTAGKILYKYTQQIFQSIENAKLEINEALSLENETISLSICSASPLIPSLLEKFSEKIPNIRIKILTNNNNCDLTINSYYSAKNDNDILLIEESILVALPKQHPFSSKEYLDIADLENISFISLSAGNSLFGIVNHYLDMHNLHIESNIYVDNPSILRSVLLKNNYATFVPELTWKSFYENEFVLLQIRSIEMKRYIYLHIADNRYISKALHECQNIIQNEFLKISK